MFSGGSLTLEQVADELATTKAQVHALVRRGDLDAIKLGGPGPVAHRSRGPRVLHAYKHTAAWVNAHPYSNRAEVDEGDQDDDDPR